MSTAPPPVPAPQPAPPQPEKLSDLLTYARTIANEEIASIERLHERTMKYIGRFATAVLGLGTVAVSVVGWFGYQNL